MNTERLRCAFQCHMIAEPLQGCDGPLAVTLLLFGSLVRVALLLIIGPLPEQMIHDHQNLMPHCHCGTFAAQARFEAPEGSPQKRPRSCGLPTHIGRVRDARSDSVCQCAPDDAWRHWRCCAG